MTSKHPADSSTSQTAPGLTPNRRTVVKAAAGIGAAVAVGGGVTRLPRIEPAAAQEVDGTRGRSWSEADNINTSIKLEGGGWVTLQTEFPFWAFGFAWDTEVGTWPAVQYGFSYDGVTWDEGHSMTAHSDGGPPPADDRHHTPLHFTDGQQYIRYRTVDGEGNLVVLDRFQVTYIDPTDGPWEEDRPMTLMRTSAVNTDTHTPPSIITRAQWGAIEGHRFNSRGEEIWRPEYAPVEHAIVHHAAVNYSTSGYNAVRSIYYYHAITQGWGDIGYNYVVDTAGRIFEGRVGGANVIGGHAYQYAVGSSGICVMGDFTWADPPHVAKVALANIVAYVTRNLNPHGRKQFHQVPNLPTIAAHRDVVSSTCPGNGLYDDMPWLRNQVANILDSGALDSEVPGGIVPGDWVKVETEDGSGLQMRSHPGLTQLVVDTIPDGTRVEVEEGARHTDGHNWYLVMYNNREGWVVADHLLVDPPDADPMPGYSFGENIRLGSSIPLKSSPSTSASTVATESGSWAMLLAGPYPAGGTQWFQVQTESRRAGWITINQFNIADVTSPSPAFEMGQQVRTVRWANIRVRAGLPQTVQGGVGAGTRLTISVEPVNVTGRTWYGVYGGTGIGGGWIDAADIERLPEPVSAVGQTYRVTEGMNFRSGAGLGFAVVGSLAVGSTGTVIGGPTNRDGYRWWQLRTSNGSQGWAAGNWLVATGGTPTPTDPPPPTPGGKFTIGDTARVTEGLNMRSGPSTGSGVIRVLAAGTTGSIVDGPRTANGYTWWRIQTSVGTGWVVENWVVRTGAGTPPPDPPPTDPPPTDPPPTPGGKFTIGDNARVTEGLNMRSGAGTGNSVLAVLPVGTVGSVVDGPRSANGYTWWRIQTNRGTGWVVENWISPTGGSSPTQPRFQTGATARVTEALNLRSGAGTGHGVIAVLPAGSTGRVVDGPRSANGYVWWRIETSRGTGWAAQDWLR